MMRRNIQRSVRLAGIIVVGALIMLGVFMPSIASAAPVSAPILAQPSSYGQGFYYTVCPGDTLSGIASRYGTTVNAIMTANGLHSTQIYVGQVLFIPSHGGGGGGGGQCSQYYTVRPGDSLSKIASWFGVSVQSLAQANNIYNPSHIYVGQVLCIPSGYHPQPYPPHPYPPQPVPPQPVPPQPYPPQPVPPQPYPPPPCQPQPWQPCQPHPYPPGPTCGQYYTVQPGDSLSKIASWCHTTVQNLVWLNNIQNPRIIVPGQVLRIY